ncbi:MAG: response regulator [Nitrospinaceae bacterium]|nr:response regulator [Nitrospinaceae bacterium]NIR53229.1 response regulator [Nitrospinaceae bacterium]NIS83624.1 response regulator [Nitrospinaceae bacterium]NIT80414.1 response regulator [Nitrospinaceae bacterium]NIU42757.1 response regulator [Nitrospinaceae bacterium]
MSDVSYKILLADDNPVNLDLTERLLTKRGHIVTTVENGIDAVERFLEQPFDIILLDLEMPGISGIEAARQIRSKEKAPAFNTPPFTPIAAMTAHDEETERSACLLVGMDGFITKPIDIKTIGQTLQQIITEAHAKRK